MQFGLIISVLLHVAILGWAVITIQTQRELRVAEPEPVAIDLISPSDVTKLRQGVRTAKQMEAVAKEGPPAEVVRKEAPKPSPVATKPKAEPPPEEAKPEPKEAKEPPKEVAKVEPKPEPKPEPKVEPKVEPKPDPIAEKLNTTDNPDPALEQAKLDEKLREEQRKADEEKRLQEQKKADEQKALDEARKQAALKKRLDDAKKAKEAARKKEEERLRKEAEAKKKFNPEELAALLNKTPDKGAPQNTLPSEVPTKNKGPIAGAKEGRDQVLSASESARLVGLLTRKIQECYRPPVGAAAGLDGLKVRLSFDLKRDGTVVGTPRATGVGGAPVSPLAAEAAERAVFGCQPYDMLPPDKYEAWKGIDLIFNPKDLFGG